jgi:hypothetical protein
MITADPKVPEPELTSQGRIYRRATETDESFNPNTEGENKSWISDNNNIDDQRRDELSRPQPDKIAEEVDKRLGPIATVKNKLADTVETAVEKASATSNSANDTKLGNSKFSFSITSISLQIHFYP